MNRGWKIASLLGMSALVSLVARPADASASPLVVLNFTQTMTGAQETPPNGSPGQCVATVTLDTVSGAVSVSGTYSGLTGNANAAHIHGPAGFGVPAGILVGLTHTGGTSGTLGGGGTLTPAQVADLQNGLHYLNLHSSTFGGGELRAQIGTPVPSMSSGTVVLLVGGALVVGVILLQRRRSPATVASA